MKLPILATFVVGVLFGSIVAIARADLAPEDVRNAMKLGVGFLKDHQHPDGTWADYHGQEGGVTALCTLALLNAGESLEEEHVKKAMTYLRRLPAKTTYVVALQTMALCRASPEADQGIIGRNVEWLEASQVREGQPDRKGGWAYGASDRNVGIPGDASNAQFALLALYEASRVAESGRIKLAIKYGTWKLAHTYWSGNQREDGSWGYYKGQPGTGSMTCAGLASMVIVGDVLHESDARVNGDTIDCCALAPKGDKEQIEKGIEWLRRNFHIDANPPYAHSDRDLWHLYYLYGLERAGRLTARRKIGEHDWYREGAEYFVHVAGPDSLTPYWKGHGPAEDNEDIATSLALLFLSKGRWPVLMAKAQYSSKEAEWNCRAKDVNNMTIYVEGQWKHEMTWQSVDVRKATVDDLLQVPVLFFSGGGSPLPSDATDREKLARNLRDYVDRGGFIFADGDCCSDEFDGGFRRLMELVFPEPEYRLKKLDAAHPIWVAEQKVPPDQVRLLLGIDYGCRTSVVFAPHDPPGAPRASLACLWELSRSPLRANYSSSVKAQIQGGLAIGINVLAYATNRELKSKDLIPETIVKRGAVDKVDRGKLYVAKLQHPGGCDAAPRALANLMEEAADKLKLRVELHPKLIGITDATLYDYPVVFMHGRNAFRLTDAERQALRDYVRRGGLLFGDAICGNPAFANAFGEEMKAIFPKNALTAIPARDPIWTTKYGGFDLATVVRRDPQPVAAGQPMQSTLRRVPPELKGISIDNRYGVIFSEFDLSCALEKHDSMECRGYSRDDAARIGLNVLLYGVQQ